MSNSTIRQIPRRLSDSSVSDLENYLLTTPAIIIPVGSLEPVGKNLPLGIVAEICEALTALLSMRTDCMVAPLLSYGYNTPFKAFEGCTGISEHTFINVLIECCNSLLFQGFKRIMIFSTSTDGENGIQEAAARVCKRGEVTFCTLQKNEQFRLFCARKNNSTELWRNEWGTVALAKSLLPKYRDIQLPTIQHPLPDKKQFKSWYKRGKDPQKLRKMIPDIRLSSFAGSITDADAKEVMNFTVSLLLENYREFLTKF